MIKIRRNAVQRSGGFTLLEVVTAMAITSILLPVVGIVFYQILTVPPDQSARLTLTNEIQRLASILYQDGQRADNFSAGDGNPYFGNFTWTDYSTGYDYFVSYYYVNTCTDETPCSHIARQVTVTIPTATPIPTGPTPTATATPSPTPTPSPSPSPTPIPTTYNMCSGGSGDRWAYGRTWSLIDGKTNGHPNSPTDFLTFTSTHLPPYLLYTADSGNYSAVCLNNSSGCTTGDGTTYWRYANTIDALEAGWDSQLFVFKIYQDGDSVTNLSVTWTAHGSQGDLTFHTYLKIWNRQTGLWETIVDRTSATGSKCFGQYVYSILNTSTYPPASYIEAGSRNVSILAEADMNSVAATQGIYTDYILLTVH